MNSAGGVINNFDPNGNMTTKRKASLKIKGARVTILVTSYLILCAV